MEKDEFEDLIRHELKDDTLCHVEISEAPAWIESINVVFLDGPLKGKLGRIEIRSID